MSSTFRLLDEERESDGARGMEDVKDRWDEGGDCRRDDRDDEEPEDKDEEEDVPWPFEPFVKPLRYIPFVL